VEHARDKTIEIGQMRRESKRTGLDSDWERCDESSEGDSQLVRYSQYESFVDVETTRD